MCVYIHVCILLPKKQATHCWRLETSRKAITLSVSAGGRWSLPFCVMAEFLWILASVSPWFVFPHFLNFSPVLFPCSSTSSKWEACQRTGTLTNTSFLCLGALGLTGAYEWSDLLVNKYSFPDGK